MLSSHVWNVHCLKFTSTTYDAERRFHISRNHHMSMKWSMDLSVDSFQYCPFPGERAVRGFYLFLYRPLSIPFLFCMDSYILGAKRKVARRSSADKALIYCYIFFNPKFSATFFNKSDHFQVSTNWTWSAQIQKWKPRFHSNVPWWTTLEDFEISPF